MGGGGSSYFCVAVARDVGKAGRNPASYVGRNLRQSGGGAPGLLYGPAHAKPRARVLSIRHCLPANACHANWGSTERGVDNDQVGGGAQEG